MTSNLNKQVIGRAEKIYFPDISNSAVPARIDTGAKTSSIWGAANLESSGELSVVFFGKGHESYTGKKMYFKEYKQAFVASSSGHSELRYKVKLRTELKGRKITANFTIANRSEQAYPVLVGRNLLAGKFIVDVKLGETDVITEKRRSKKIQSGK